MVSAVAHKTIAGSHVIRSRIRSRGMAVCVGRLAQLSLYLGPTPPRPRLGFGPAPGYQGSWAGIAGKGLQFLAATRGRPGTMMA